MFWRVLFKCMFHLVVCSFSPWTRAARRVSCRSKWFRRRPGKFCRERMLPNPASWRPGSRWTLGEEEALSTVVNLWQIKGMLEGMQQIHFCQPIPNTDVSNNNVANADADLLWWSFRETNTSLIKILLYCGLLYSSVGRRGVYSGSAPMRRTICRVCFPLSSLTL